MSSIAQDRLDGTGPVTIVGKDWTATVPSRVAQQFRDGAAIDRLRGCSALMAHEDIVIGQPWDDETFSVAAGCDADAVTGWGATVAEAADACREKLEARQ